MSRLRTTDRATGDDLDVLDFYERETERLHRAIDEPPAVVAIRQRYPEWKARLLIQAFYRRHPDHDTNYARRAFADGGYGRDGETPITPAKGGRKRRGRDMRKAEIKVGAVYMAKVTRTVVPVRIMSVCGTGGWWARNLATGRDLLIRTAARLQREVTAP